MFINAPYVALCEFDNGKNGSYPGEDVNANKEREVKIEFLL